MEEAYLPEHIIYQIFLRMPTKPLFRLKCLSKTWNCVISDPKFIKSRSRRMIFLPSLPFHVIDKNVTGASMIKSHSSLINPESYDGITIVGSFNGIVLLVLRYRKPIIIDHNKHCHHIILYNPLSGEFKTVPLSQSYDAYSNHCYGFGYGSTTDDLKIVSLIGHPLKSCEVFDLKTWSWSTPSELIRDYSLKYSGTFSGGFLYWVATRLGSFWPHLILALDIKKMVFSEIKIGCWMYRLGTYNGRLSMLCSQNGKGYKLRVMNVHGSGESWSLLCSFTSSLSSFNFRHGRFCILDDGKLLISELLSNQLIIYDMFRDLYMDLNASTGFAYVHRLESAEYVESLISPSDICSLSM